MSEVNRPIRLGNHIQELPKSELPASAADSSGYYAFYCSSPDPGLAATWIAEGEAVLMGTGGNATVHYGSDRFSYSTDTWAFRSNSRELRTDYLFFRLQKCLPDIEYRGFEGSGLRHLRKNYIRDMMLDIPERKQQQRIAEILSTVDEAIEQTEALIAKLKQIKAGLMHDLFTRGVTPNGQLRPSRDEAPQLYKESPLGWIPKEWGVDIIGSLLAHTAYPMRSGPFGSSLLKNELTDQGVPLLGIDNVHRERFVSDYTRFISPTKFQELRQYAVFPNDVVITIMGTVGRCCVVPDDIGPAMSSKHLWTLTFDHTRIQPDIFCWQLNYAPWILSWFRRHSQGAVMDAIQSSTLRTARVPIPPMPEQEAIRSRHLRSKAAVAAHEKALQKLCLLKRGLMRDLLTGRVRVPMDANDEGKNRV